MFRKDHTTVIGRWLLTNQFLKDSFIKVRADIVYSEEVCDFVDSKPEVGQKHYTLKNLLINSLSDAKNLFLMQL